MCSDKPKTDYVGPWVTRAFCACGATFGMFSYVMPFLIRSCPSCGAKKDTFVVRMARWVQDLPTFWKPDKDVGRWEFYEDVHED